MNIQAGGLGEQTIHNPPSKHAQGKQIQYPDGEKKFTPWRWRQHRSVKQPFVQNSEKKVSRSKKNWVGVASKARGKETNTRDNKDNWMQQLQEVLSLGRI